MRSTGSYEDVPARVTPRSPVNFFEIAVVLLTPFAEPLTAPGRDGECFAQISVISKRSPRPQVRHQVGPAQSGRLRRLMRETVASRTCAQRYFSGRLMNKPALFEALTSAGQQELVRSSRIHRGLICFASAASNEPRRVSIATHALCLRLPVSQEVYTEVDGTSRSFNHRLTDRHRWTYVDSILPIGRCDRRALGTS